MVQVTVVQVGAAPVDPVSGKVRKYNSNHCVTLLILRVVTETHQVLSMNGEVWDAMLNQTDLTKNANKYAFYTHFYPKSYQLMRPCIGSMCSSCYTPSIIIHTVSFSFGGAV